MPKSIEHYQQETGRAGRDGLEAECVLLYSAADVPRWESLITRGAEDAAERAEVVEGHMALLREMRRYAAVPYCRHRMLSEYFGQEYDKQSCEACDVCLGEIEGAEDATATAQKILSCVARVNESFGVGHVVEVLQGADSEAVRRRGHDRLSTYGLLSELPRKTLTNWVYQLVDQALLERTTSDRPVLKLNGASWEVMRGRRTVVLLQPPSRRKRRSRAEAESWAGVDEGLFEHLRKVRRDLAARRGVPAYVIFGDATLRDMARTKPRDVVDMLAVHGVGQTKLGRFGQEFLDAIAEYGRGS
jgi:ATP-dependent DNA helicase RecQ